MVAERQPDDRPMSRRWAASGGAPVSERPGDPFSPRVHQVEVTRTGAVLELEVTGAIPDVEAEVNRLGPGLTETERTPGPTHWSDPRFSLVCCLSMLAETPGGVVAEIVVAALARLGVPIPWRTTLAELHLVDIDGHAGSARCVHHCSPIGHLRVGE